MPNNRVSTQEETRPLIVSEIPYTEDWLLRLVFSLVLSGGGFLVGVCLAHTYPHFLIH